MDSFGLKEEVTAFIIDKARELEMTKVVLFGSRARGSFDAKSDIDLAIEGSALSAYEELLEEVCPTLLMFDFVDLSSSISDDLRTRISEEGLVLHEIR